MENPYKHLEGRILLLFDYSDAQQQVSVSSIWEITIPKENQIQIEFKSGNGNAGKPILCSVDEFTTLLKGRSISAVYGIPGIELDNTQFAFLWDLRSANVQNKFLTDEHSKLIEDVMVNRFPAYYTINETDGLNKIRETYKTAFFLKRKK